MTTLVRATALSLALMTMTAPAALAESAPTAEAMFQATTLSLAAHGEVKVVPDMATIALGVQTEAPTAAQAMQANAEQMARVVASLRRAGVEARDIRTSQLNVSPQYAYPQNQPPRLTGYQASNQVTVTARDLKRLGQTVDAAVAAGATNVGGISFGLLDPTVAEDAARLAAVHALQAKAELYAKAAGRPILRLVNLSEGASYDVRPPSPMVMSAAKIAYQPETVVSPGEMQVRIDVSGVYELGR